MSERSFHEKQCIAAEIPIPCLARSFGSRVLQRQRASGRWTDDKDQHHSTAADFLRLGVRPIAIGRHGVGPYPAGTPDLPTENTVDSVRQAGGSSPLAPAEIGVGWPRDGSHLLAFGIEQRAESDLNTCDARYRLLVCLKTKLN
jgi:hypothetical protein